MSDFDFDPNDYEPSQAFEPIPGGWYVITVTEAEMRPTKAGPDMLTLTYEVDGNCHPDFANRKVWDCLNIKHPTSEKARDISRRNLSAICKASGVQARNASDLLGASFAVKVTVRPAEDGYEATNDVKGYRPAGNAPQTSAASAPATATSSHPKAKAPWKS